MGIQTNKISFRFRGIRWSFVDQISSVVCKITRPILSKKLKIIKGAIFKV